ncbi:uncharacterized protein LOC127565596 [Drosophila albomicans]|uniref:Uncharacterized protein LOC127565596 n=1 Tax=Drosophila albomicans TaxID=7291 RepID=A0A9C6SVZ2_DROAB|nr:uncharacterized protein LOC127565596 [Drosophila albomicans]
MMYFKADIFYMLIFCLRPISCGRGQTYEVTQIDTIDIPGNLVETSSRIIGRDSTINGTWEFLEEVNDDAKMEIGIFVDTAKNGDWKPRALKPPVLGVCTSLKRYFNSYIKKSFITGVTTDFDFKNGDLCPVPKGKSWIKNVILDTDKWMNVMPTGYVKVQISFTKDNVFGGAFAVIVNIENKSS